MKKILQENKLYILIFFILFEIFSLLNLINLKMPPQVSVGMLTDLEHFVYHFSWHGIRLLLCLPAILLSIFTNLTYDSSFTIYSFFILTCIYLYINNIFNLLLDKLNGKFLKIFVVVFLLFLTSKMNGRLLLPYLGYLILIGEFLNIQNCEKINCKYLIIGLILTTMSTGSFGVGLIYAFLMLCFSNKLRNFIIELSNIQKIVMSSIFIYFAIMIKKLIDYYTSKGDLLLILSHGTGRFIAWDNLLILLMSAISMICLNYFIITRYLNDKKFPLILAVLIPLWCSVLGYSAATMLICPLFILTIFYMLQFKERIISCH